MYVAADLANWLEEEVKKNDDLVYGAQERARKKQIEAFVHDNPDYFAVAVVWDLVDDVNNSVNSLLNGRTLSNMSTGFVIDLGKLGTGAADGTAWGIFEDALRVISIVPWGRVSEFVGTQVFRVAGPAMTRLKSFYWGAIEGKSCVPISVARALQQTGTKLFITLEDVASAMKRSLGSFDFHGASTEEAKQALRTFGAAFDEIEAGFLRNWKEIEILARNTKGVLIVGLKRLKATGQHGFHRIVVSNTRNGVKIIDRKGVFNSLEELSRRYGSLHPGEFYDLNLEREVLQVKNWMMDEALISKLNTLGPLGAMVVQGVQVVIGFNPQVGAEKVRLDYEEFLAKNEPPADSQPPSQYVPPKSLKFTHQVLGPVVQRHDWLSSIAQKWYGDMLLWPILFDHNRDAKFTDPNRIKVGQMIQVPDISDIPAAELNQIRQRGRNWR